MLGKMMRTHLHRGFTLVELMIALVVLGMLAAVALPSIRDFMLVQRLKSINAQVITDLQFARTEAVSRNTWLRVAFASNESLTCYSLYTTNPGIGNTVICNCAHGPGLACPTGATEVRTVQIPRSQSVTVMPAGDILEFAYDNVTGQIYEIPTDTASVAMPGYAIDTGISSTRKLRTTVGRTGRPTACAFGMGLGAEPCP